MEPVGRAESPGAPDGFSCPKCLRSVRFGSQSCPKCGLVFALWESGLARPETAGQADPDGAMWDLRAVALWRRVEEDPHDETAHDAYVTHCWESGQLDLAARRYQSFLLRDPDHPLGRIHRDRIILLAQFNHRPARRPRYALRRFSGIKTVLILGMTALLWGLVMIPMLLEQ